MAYQAKASGREAEYAQHEQKLFGEADAVYRGLAAGNANAALQQAERIEGRRRSSCSNYSKVVRKVEERLVGRRRLRVRLVAEEGQRVRLAVEHQQRHRQRLGKLLLSAHQRARAVAHSATLCVR